MSGSPSIFKTLPPDRPRPGAVPAPRPAAPPRPVAPAVPVRPAAREDRPAPPPPLDRLKGATVRLHMVDGSILTGVFVEVAKFEVVIRPEIGRLVVAMKAAIAWVEEVAK